MPSLPWLAGCVTDMNWFPVAQPEASLSRRAPWTFLLKSERLDMIEKFST